MRDILQFYIDGQFKSLRVNNWELIGMNTTLVPDGFDQTRFKFRAACISICLLLAGSVFAQVHDPKALSADPLSATDPIAPALQGLGDHHFEVTTSSPQSQYFFDQGYRLTLGTNHI